jgi:hypothetical protein
MVNFLWRKVVKSSGFSNSLLIFIVELVSKVHLLDHSFLIIFA